MISGGYYASESRPDPGKASRQSSQAKPFATEQCSVLGEMYMEKRYRISQAVAFCTSRCTWSLTMITAKSHYLSVALCILIAVPFLRKTPVQGGARQEQLTPIKPASSTISRCS